MNLHSDESSGTTLSDMFVAVGVVGGYGLVSQGLQWFGLSRDVAGGVTLLALLVFALVMALISKQKPKL